MAEVTLTVTSAADGPTYVNAVDDGHAYANDGQTLLFVKNSSGGAYTVTHVEQGTCDFGHGGTNTTDSAPDSETTAIWAVRNVVRWNDTGGKAHITFTTSVPGTPSQLQVAAVTYIDT